MFSFGPEYSKKKKTKKNPEAEKKKPKQIDKNKSEYYSLLNECTLMIWNEIRMKKVRKKQQKFLMNSKSSTSIQARSIAIHFQLKVPLLCFIFCVQHDFDMISIHIEFENECNFFPMISCRLTWTELKFIPNVHLIFCCPVFQFQCHYCYSVCVCVCFHVIIQSNPCEN